jgi:hypothetical protein
MNEKMENVGDVISRQAAIDALHMHLMYRMGTDSNKKRLDDWINGLPSVQETHEERTETHACDCISRQWLMECVNEGWIKFDTEKDKNRFIHLVRDIAPSAQPTATWLIHKWGDDAKCSNCGRSFKDVYDMDNYDNFCRHCGTHMKGIKAI